MAITNPNSIVKIEQLATFKNAYDAQLATKLATKVEVEEGKGLTTNDFTDELKGKVESAVQSVSVKGEDIVTAKDGNVEIDLSSFVKTADLSTVYRYKGSVENFADLPTENVENGDVYNVAKADKDNGIKAGDNVAWNGEAWDNLSGTIDLSGYVEKVEGKGLSTNDLTDELVAKLNTVAGAAEENVIEGIQVDGVDLAVDNEKKVNIDLSGKVDKVDGSRLMTNEEGTKLEGIEEGAQVNVIDTVKVNGTALEVTDKAVNIDLSGFVTQEEGKVLSSNDYTDEHKAKVESITYATDEDIMSLFEEVLP